MNPHGLIAHPLVSVIIPYFNRIELTRRAVSSVLAQTYSNFEIILISDASTEDDSILAELLSNKKNVVHIKLQKNVGPSGARNEGINSAKGEYIAFLDSDDTWEKDKLKIQIDQMLKNNWSFSHTSYYRHDTRNGQVKAVRSGLRHYIFPWPAFRCIIATPTVVMDRNLLCDFSFRSDLRFAEDTFLWLELSKRLILHGIDIPLTNVFTGELTTALNDSIHAKALRLLAIEGLAGHHILLSVHAMYRVARKIQRKISRLSRHLF